MHNEVGTCAEILPGYLSLFVLQVCSESELRKLVCVKIWNGMNLTGMQIFRSVILITGYVTLKPRQLKISMTRSILPTVVPVNLKTRIVQ